MNQKLLKNGNLMLIEMEQTAGNVFQSKYAHGGRSDQQEKS